MPPPGPPDGGRPPAATAAARRALCEADRVARGQRNAPRRGSRPRPPRRRFELSQARGTGPIAQAARRCASGAEFHTWHLSSAWRRSDRPSRFRPSVCVFSDVYRKSRLGIQGRGCSRICAGRNRSRKGTQPRDTLQEPETGGCPSRRSPLVVRGARVPANRSPKHKVSDAESAAVPFTGHDWHPDGNYSIAPHQLKLLTIFYARVLIVPALEA